jgi:AraC-like DNA-binding protein
MNYSTTSYHYYQDGTNTVPRDCMVFCTTQALKETVTTNNHGGDILGLFINLRDTFAYHIDNGPTGTIKKSQFNLIYLPQESCSLSFLKGAYSCFFMRFTPKHLEAFIPMYPELENFLKKVAQRIPTLLCNINHDATPDMMNSVSNIVTAQYRDMPFARMMYLESKYMSLLMDALNKLRHPNRLPFSDGDLEKIVRARDMINTDLRTVYSVGLLADRVHIDKRKLMDGFKILFRTTIYNFILENRLKRAISMLRDTNLPVGDIAKKLGYKSLNTFSDTFRRKLGYAPSAVREAEVEENGEGGGDDKILPET